MKNGNTLTNFAEKQEVLDNIRGALKKLYSGEEDIGNPEYLTRLTEKTYEIMDYIDYVHKDLIKEIGVIETAEEFNTSPKLIANDIVEIMILSTIAKQNIILDDLKKI